MGKSYADYLSNRSNSHSADKSRKNCKSRDRYETHASRNQLRSELCRDSDLSEATVPERKRNPRYGGWSESSYFEPSRRPPKLKAVYNETGHDLHSLTLEEVERALNGSNDPNLGTGWLDYHFLSASCPVKACLGQDATRTHQILTKQVERRGKASPFRPKPKEKREFFSE